MLRRYVSAAALALILAVIALAVPAASRPADRQPLVFTGQVQMVSTTDGSRTAIAVDLDKPGAPGYGIADRAFRVQHMVPQLIDYTGPATIVYTKAGLLVERPNQPGWLFEVDPLGLLPSPSGEVATVPVIGVSQHAGTAIRQPADQVTNTLLTTGCGSGGVTALAPGGGSGCDKCQAGGSGTDGCTVGCGGGTYCEANCVAGYYSCCNCPSGCGCCPGKMERPQAAVGVGASRATRSR